MSDSVPTIADLRHLAPAGPVATDPTHRLLDHGTNRNPQGIELSADQFGLVLNQRRWMPIMGEMQYSRVAQSRWRDSLLAMKAGGIDIVATYVFWIHHEEQQGVFDFTGRRSLRDFLILCAELGLDVQLRIGPWAHGECRNGGFPDWLVKKGSLAHAPAESKEHAAVSAPAGISLRSDDPAYLEFVRRYFEQLAIQARGLLWKDGGPVSGIQIENEYSGDSEHLLKLRQMALELGLDVPLYYFTGWPKPKTPMPFGKMIPLFGGYAEGMWDRSIEVMPDGYWEAYTFKPRRIDSTIATDHFGVRNEKDDKQVAQYPYLTCEMGGGMVTSYHRRIRIFPHDVLSVSFIKLASGNSMPGYYMYHGGTNPTGKITSLNESQASGYPNDLCVMSYDFQAPIGEFGQIRDHYHRLRRLHMLIHDYGDQLITMRPVFSDSPPREKTDVQTLRWCVRGDNTAAFIFVNNYQRLQPMPAKPGVQITVKLASGDVTVPRQGLTIPPDRYFAWPVQLNLGGVRLRYATAELLCTIDLQDARYVFFSQITGMPAHFAFDHDAGEITTTGQLTRDAGQVYVENLQPALAVAIRLAPPAGKNVCIVLLDEATSLAAWKIQLAGKTHLALTTALPLEEAGALRCCLRGANPASIALFPPPASIKVNGAPDAGRMDGIFRRYDLPASLVKPPEAVGRQIRPASNAQPVLIGPHGVAEAPGDSEFVNAAVWKIILPPDLSASNSWLLRFDYVGDVARVYVNGRLITDNFYNGTCFDCGFSPDETNLQNAEILLKVLPLRKDAPICLLPGDWPKNGSNAGTAELTRVEIVQQTQHHVTLE